MIQCNRCLEVKQEEEFKIRPLNKSGYECRCTKCINELNTIYYKKNKEKVNIKNREYVVENKEKVALRKKKWKEQNRERLIIQRREYKARKRIEDPLFKLKENLRRRISKSLNVSHWKKDTSTKIMLGCEYQELFNHLEKQFTEGMNWDNQGQWHIDHIKPLSLATTQEELVELCHYTNLQPLWAIDNIKKGNSF